MTWDDPSVLAAFLSAVAATAAAIATWRGPLAAAKTAEQLRRVGEVQQEIRRFKLNVFAAIMQERAEIYSAEAVRAFNSIDVAFSNSSEVREAWAELFQALNTNPMSPPHVVDERIRKLLREMALDLGISETLRLDDFARVYFPTALAQESQVRQLERQDRLRRLTTQTSPAANTSNLASDLWPPKPDVNKS